MELQPEAIGLTPIKKYAPNQPRDQRGRWTSTGGVSVHSFDGARDAAYRAKVREQGGTEAAYSREQMVQDLRQPDGGFTYNSVTGKAANTGFAVSPYPERSRALDLTSMDDAQLDSAIRQYERDNADLLLSPDNRLGGWHDPKTGTAYLDVSVVLPTSGAAHDLGLKRDQIAYFDLQSFESVDINRDATSGGAAH